MRKICGICKVDKDFNDFHNHKRHKDGKTSDCKICVIKRVRAYAKKNKDIIKEKRKDYIKNYNKMFREQNPDYFKNYRLNNKEKTRAYLLRNKERIRAKSRIRLRERRRTDMPFKVIGRVRNRIIKIFKEKPKFVKSLGCSFEQFKKHIEELFTEGMSWDNYGQWHIDHHFPLMPAYKLGEEAFKKACHYTNLKPLWAKDNLDKADKIPVEFLDENGDVKF